MSKITLLWNKIPEQIRRLLIPLFIIMIGYFLVRWILVPPDFGLWATIGPPQSQRTRKKRSDTREQRHAPNAMIKLSQQRSRDTTGGFPVKHAMVLLWRTLRIPRTSSRPLHGPEHSACCVMNISLPGQPDSPRSFQILITRHNHAFPAIGLMTLNHHSRSRNVRPVTQRFNAFLLYPTIPTLAVQAAMKHLLSITPNPGNIRRKVCKTGRSV